MLPTDALGDRQLFAIVTKINDTLAILNHHEYFVAYTTSDILQLIRPYPQMATMSHAHFFNLVSISLSAATSITYPLYNDVMPARIDFLFE